MSGRHKLREILSGFASVVEPLEDQTAFERQTQRQIHIMYDGWEALSQKSRIELLACDRDSYDRIEHRAGWFDQLRGRVQAYRARKRQADRLL